MRELPAVPASRLAALLLLLAIAPPLSHAQSGEADVRVIGVTPLPGVGVPPAQIPASLQRAGGEALERSPGIGLADTLNRAFGSVHVNELQGNRLQPELSFRGYTASPLLGTPQGLSVYLDGVRLNQPFGDVVSWDLVPRSALSSINLVPGSNPLFGLNTLGGAVTLQTKDGRSHPGGALEMRAGTHRFGEAVFEQGGHGTALDWYVTGVALNDAGWREASPSHLGQLFGKLGWQDAATDLKLTYAHADTSLNGNGLQEEKFLRRDYGSVYTKPDITQARSHFANLAWSHALNDTALFTGNAYYRESTTTTYNADLNDASLDQSLYQPTAAEQAALTAAGYRGFPTAGESAANTPFPAWRCIANVLRNDEPGEKCNALVNRTRTAQQSRGVAAQWSSSAPLAGLPSRASVGLALDESQANFSQSSQLGYLNADRSVTLLPAFADGGVTGGNVDGVPFDTRVALDARTRTSSLYAAETITPIEALHVSASARHNRTRVHNADRLRAPGLTSLDGDYVFARLNPAAGVAFTPSPALNAYLGYNEGSRTPSAIELGCANPAQPCRLPNAMAGDPPLRQVVTRTWETGLHGVLPGGSRWNAGLFRAENADDILFVAAPLRSQFGYFRNFGRTRREGAELGWSQATGAWRTAISYSYVHATFQSPETLTASGNSSNDAALAGTPGLDGTIRIRPGDRMPLVPAHQLKASAGYAVTPAFSLDAQLIAMGMSYARGNENNLDQPDGVRYLGAGRSPGYAILNLGARHEIDRSLSLFAQLDNVFDRRYSSGSLLAATGFDASGNVAARPLPAVGTAFPLVHATFQAPGAPRSAWIGVRYRWR